MPASSIVDWWPFDEAGGSVAHDTAGFTNNGAYSGGPTVGTVKVGRALCFNGKTASVVVKNHPEINFQGDCSNDAAEAITIDAWIATKASGLQVILDKRAASPNFLRGYSLFILNGRLGFQMATGPGNAICGSPGSACTNYVTPATAPLVNDGNPHFIAVTVSRCRGAVGKLYIDNFVDTFKPMVGDISNKVNLFIGKRYPIPTTIFFDGCIDELEFFKDVLSQSELSQIFNAGAKGKCKRKVLGDAGAVQKQDQ